MYSPEAISRDITSNLMYSSGNTSSTNGFKSGFLEGGLFKNREMLGSSSDLFQPHVQQPSGGLTRYRSAPSSYFASYLEGSKNNTTNNNSESSESDSIFSAFMNSNKPSNEIPHHTTQGNHYHHQQQQHQEQLKLEMNEVELNPPRFQQNGSGFSSANSAMVGVGYQAAVSAGGGTVVGSYAMPIGAENQGQVRMHNRANSPNLLRQSSSPAGFFSGYDVTREVGSFRKSNGTNGEASSSTCGLSNHMNFTSGPSSSSRFMPSIAENGNEAVGTGSPDHGQIGNGNQANQGYVSNYHNESWNDSSFNSFKRSRDGDLKMYSDFSGLDSQDEEPRNHTPTLTHHLSLPKTAIEMSVVEKYLQFQQDSVPCKIRAKRGCATHPRSIAERMRRTRISERMKKLQELFPNMDKQTNTADMLDLAVEYIKDLQSQVQKLTETRDKCTCSSKQPQCSTHDG